MHACTHVNAHAHARTHPYTHTYVYFACDIYKTGGIYICLCVSVCMFCDIYKDTYIGYVYKLNI